MYFLNAQQNLYYSLFIAGDEPSSLNAEITYITNTTCTLNIANNPLHVVGFSRNSVPYFSYKYGTNLVMDRLYVTNGVTIIAAL